VEFKCLPGGKITDEYRKRQDSVLLLVQFFTHQWTRGAFETLSERTTGIVADDHIRQHVANHRHYLLHISLILWSRNITDVQLTSCRMMWDWESGFWRRHDVPRLQHFFHERLHTHSELRTSRTYARAIVDPIQTFGVDGQWFRSMYYAPDRHGRVQAG